jgi:hypothetical protein
MRKKLLLLASHLGALLVGFILGIYLLPILTAPPAPTSEQVQSLKLSSKYEASFVRDLQDSDALHYGEGAVYISANQISFNGKLSPGPDFKLYLAKQFIETESDFLKHKSSMQQLDSIKTFENFIVDVPSGVNIEDYSTVIVWCESFDQFITAAKYR